VRSFLVSPAASARTMAMSPVALAVVWRSRSSCTAATRAKCTRQREYAAGFTPLAFQPPTPSATATAPPPMRLMCTMCASSPPVAS